MVLANVIVVGRLVQFVCAAVLCGCPIFCLYGSPVAPTGLGRLLRWACIALILGALVTLSSQTAVMADSVRAAFNPADIWAVIEGSQIGCVTALRVGLAATLLMGLVLTKQTRNLWVAASLLGAGVAASFAWTGHGGAGEGLLATLHIVVDVLHLVAAGAWIGALVSLTILVLQAEQSYSPEDLKILQCALKSFSGIGFIVVAVILATGALNSFILVGAEHVGGLTHKLYGVLLLWKVALFLAMLGLAALNRYALTPRLSAPGRKLADLRIALQPLKISLAAETLAAFLVLIVVSVLGTLAPPSS